MSHHKRLVGLHAAVWARRDQMRILQTHVVSIENNFHQQNSAVRQMCAHIDKCENKVGNGDRLANIHGNIVENYSNGVFQIGILNNIIDKEIDRYDRLLDKFLARSMRVIIAKRQETPYDENDIIIDDILMTYGKDAYSQKFIDYLESVGIDKEVLLHESIDAEHRNTAITNLDIIKPTGYDILAHG